MRPGWIVEAVLNDWRRVFEAASAMPGALSLDERLSRVCDAIRARYSAAEDMRSYAYPVATFDDYVIFRRSTEGGKSTTWQASFEWTNDGKVNLTSEPIEVTQKWIPVRESAFAESILAGEAGKGEQTIRTEALILGPVLEGTGDAARVTGKAWDVLLIQEGLSKNRNRYQRKVLAEGAPLYENARMFLDHKLPAEIGPMGRSGAEAMGFAQNVRPVVLTLKEGTDAATNPGVLALAARAIVTKAAFREELVTAFEAGNPNFFGLSHDVRAESAVLQLSDGPAYDVTSIKAVESVDWVLKPSAGGRILRHVAGSDTPHPSLQGDAEMLKTLIESLKKAGITVPENCDEATATRLLNEGLARTAAAVVTPPNPAAITESERVEFNARIATLEASNKATARNFAGVMLNNSLLECALPDAFKTRIRKRFMQRIEDAAAAIPTQDEVTAAIKEAVEDVGALAEAGIVMPHVGTTRGITAGDGPKEKIQARLDDFFNPTKPLVSFKEIYVDATGDKNVRGRLTEEVRTRVAESMGVSVQEAMTTASLDQIFGDSIRRKMLADYAASDFANWRQTIAEVVPLTDFRTVRRMRFGGYGNLPIVAQGGPYTALTSPSDEEATYAPAKRGGTEEITLEMIKNDDVGAIRRIPGKLSRAAGQTLHEFVWDLLATNAAIYDSVALAAVGHANLTTSALSAATISALRLLIKQQADMSNSKRIGLAPRYLIVPGELEELAFQLTTSDKVTNSANNDPSFIKKLNLSVIVVEYWTDTNNYWLAASVDQSPMIEIGFLDGQEQPELFVQDNPSAGSMFSNDKISWKIRHIYGGGVMDYRPFAAGIVP